MPKKKKERLFSRLAEEVVHVVNVLIGLAQEGKYNTPKFNEEYKKFDRMSKLIVLPECDCAEIGERLVLAEDICERACELAFVKMPEAPRANLKKEFSDALKEWRSKESENRLTEEDG